MAKKYKTGRKKVTPTEKVVLVGFYTKQKHVDQHGGLYKLRQKCKELAETLEIHV